MAIIGDATAEVKADLYANASSNNAVVTLLCDTTLGDIPPSYWRYDTYSSASDNFAGGVVKPTAVSGAGRWLRFNPPPQLRTITNPSRSVNTEYQPSTTRDTLVVISMSISVVSVLIGTNSGTVSLQTSLTSGGTFTTQAQLSKVVSGVVATTQDTQVMTAVVPAGYYYKLTTAQSGTNGATFGTPIVQETSL